MQKGLKSIPFRAQEFIHFFLLKLSATPPASPNPPSTGSNSPRLGQQAPLAIARGVFVFIMKLPFETEDLHSFSLLAGNHGLPHTIRHILKAILLQSWPAFRYDNGGERLILPEVHLVPGLLYLRVGKPGCAEIIVIPEVHDPHVIAPAAIRGRRIKLQ